MPTVFYVFLGGGIGASLRYLVSVLISTDIPGGKFPFAVLTCNIVGCILIAIIASCLKSSPQSYLNPLLITGLLGGFTTFSSFGMEAHKLLLHQGISNTLLYIGITVIVGIGSVLFISHSMK